MPSAKLSSIGAHGVTGETVVIDGLSEERVLFSLRRILNDNVLCSIATVTEGERAHINTAYFCHSAELEVYFLSHPNSLHCWNVSKNSSMAIAVFSSSQKWVDPGRGAQLFGTCTSVDQSVAMRAEQLYGERFTAYAAWRETLDSAHPARDYRFYRFLVGELKILDEAEFGDAVFVHAVVDRGSGSA